METDHRERVLDDTQRAHIGKKSAGCDFLFHPIPEPGLTTVAAWRETPSTGGVTPRPRACGSLFATQGDSGFHGDGDALGVPFLETGIF